jgi:beta-1,2-mannosidase
VRPSEAPVIEPNPFYDFTDPITQQKTLWDGLATSHPAATITPDGRVGIVFQAEGAQAKDDTNGKTSRLALATSNDGLSFTVAGAPLLYADNDDQKAREYADGKASEHPSGVADPRIVVAPNGAYVMTYTQSNGTQSSIGIATSKNLQDWTKCGPAFSNAGDARYATLQSKAGAILTELHNGRVQAVKLHGKYWMYWGQGKISLATSPDLIHWTPVVDTKSGLPAVVMAPRAGHFDSERIEAGPPPVLTRKGIVLLYNGMNSATENATGQTPSPDPVNPLQGDAGIHPGAVSVGEALFSSSDPTKLLARTDHPVLTPVWPYERHGQYADGGTFAEGLIAHEGQWLLYYDGAGTVVGVARAEWSH